MGPSYSDRLVPLVMVPPKMIAFSVSITKYTFSLFDGDLTTPSDIYTDVIYTSYNLVPDSAPTYVTTYACFDA